MSVYLATRVAAGDRRRIGVPVPGSSHLYLKTAPSRSRVSITRTQTKGMRRAISLMLPSAYYAFSNTDKWVSLDYFERVNIPPLPVSLPFIVVEAKSSSSKREVNAFVEAHQGVLETIGRRSVYIFRQVSLDVAQAIADSSLFRHDTDSIANAINIDEAKVLFNILRQLNALLHTTYTLPSALALGDKGIRMVPRPLSSQSEGASTSASKVVSMDTDDLLTSDNGQEIGFVSSPGLSRIDYNPPTFPTSGIVLPFDQSSECADLAGVPAFFMTFASGFFGPPTDVRSRELNRLRGAWTSISRTFCGYQVSHLVKCFELALLSDAVCTPIIRDNEYRGSVLLSSQIIINDSYEQHFPVSREDLSNIVASLDKYTRAHNSINEIIRVACGRSSLSEEEITNILLWKTTRQLSTACITLPFTAEEKDELVRLADDVQRSGDYHQNSPDYLIRAIALLKDESKPISSDAPMFPGALFFRSRTEEVLSMFGPMVPCVDVPGAPTMTLRPTSKPPQQNFVARPIRFHDAVANWDNWRKSGQLKNGPSTRSAALHDKAFEGRDRTRVWEAVMSLYEPTEEEADDDVVYERPSKRAALGDTPFDKF